MDSSSMAILVRTDSEEHDRERILQKELTEDLIIDILARLPVKSLLRFKSVSKRWYSLILSPNFIALHSASRSHNKNSNAVSLLLESRDLSFTDITAAGRRVYTTVSVRFGYLPQTLTFSGHQGIEMVGCFNGVVCLSLPQRPQHKYALWNPATRQMRLIGDAPMKNDWIVGNLTNRNARWYGSGFCFDPVANAFKVAQITLTSSNEGTRAQVNVFSTATSSWTEKNTQFPHRIMSGGSNVTRGGAYVNGYIHWHVSISESMYILSYDMIGEVFKRIEMPTCLVYGDMRLTAYKGSLAVIVHTPADIHNPGADVWVMNDCGGSNQSWSKILTFKPSNKLVRVLGFFRKDDVDFILFYEEPDCNLYLHDPQNGATERFWITRSLSEIFLYIESLASIK